MPGSAIALLLTASVVAQSPVLDIEVRGNRRVPSETVLAYVSALRGETLSDASLEAAFRRLWDTGLFQDIEFSTVPVAGGTRLIVQVVEKPLLRAMTYRGDTVAEAELSKELRERGFDLRKGRPVSRTDAVRAARELERILGESFRITGRLKPVESSETGRVDLVFDVKRRSRRRIEEIVFRGNEVFDAETLAETMSLRPSSWTSWILRRDRLSSEKLEKDMERIRDLYRERGYLQARVGPPQIRERNDAGVVIDIPIEEGERYFLRSLSITPGALLTRDMIRDWIPLAPGDPYDAVAIDKTVERIERHYRVRGHPAVEVERQEAVEPGDRTVTLELVVREGPFLRVGTIEFRGNERYRDRDLRQYLELDEGGPFDQSELEASIRALMRLGAFEAVRPEVEPVATAGVANVTLTVDEIRRFEYLLGGSANGTQGASGALEIVSRSLLGRGETLRGNVDLGNRFQNLSVGYLDRFTLGNRFALAVDFARASLTFPDETSEDSYDLGVQLSGPAFGRHRIRFGARFTRFTLGSDLEEDVPFLSPLVGESFQTRRLAFAYRYEGRDRAVFPTAGGAALLGAELSGGFLGGDVHLGRAEARGHFVVPLDRSRQHLFVLAGRAEAVWPFDETAAGGLPRFARLFLGGESDMRGFEVRGVGPTAGDIVAGGDRLLYGTWEYQYGLHSRFRMVVFLDAGAVTATDFEGDDLPTARFDAGGELQWLAPIWEIPVRCGYGVNLDPEPNESRDRFFLSLALRF